MKIKKLALALVFGLGCIMLTGTAAQAVYINFDDGYGGATTTAAALGTHYDSDGLVFDNGFQSAYYGSSVSTPGQVYGEQDITYNGVASGDIVGHFVLAGTSTNAVTNSLSLWGTWLDSTVTATLSIYGLDSGLLGNISATGIDATSKYLSLSIAGIHSFRVSFTGGNSICGGEPCDDINGIDDITFNTTTAAAVPEPSTLLLLGSGLIGLGFVRRRFRG